MKELEDSWLSHKQIITLSYVKGTHKKRAHKKLKLSDKATDYYRIGVLKSDMHTAFKRV